MTLSLQIHIIFMSSIYMAVGDQSCGIDRFHQQKDRRIVGGSESVEGAWPWQVAVLINDTQACGGSLVSPDWVVSAAHCFHALLRLSEPAVYDDYVSPICLLPRNMKFPWGKECYVTGWGHTQWNGTQPDILREAKVRLVPHKVCNRALSYNGTIHKTALCAGFEEGGVDACQHDSGGPLACDERGRFYLTGIVSWGHESARPHKYGVYSNMFKLTTWVKKMMKKHNNVEN